MPTFRSSTHLCLRIADLGVRFEDGQVTTAAKDKVAGLRALAERGEYGITEDAPKKPAGKGGDSDDGAGTAGNAG